MSDPDLCWDISVVPIIVREKPKVSTSASKALLALTPHLPDLISFCSRPHSLCPNHTALPALSQPARHPSWEPLPGAPSASDALPDESQGSLRTYFPPLLQMSPSQCGLSQLHLFKTAPLPAGISALLIPLISYFFQSTDPLLTFYAYTYDVYYLLSVSPCTGGTFISVHWCAPTCLRATPNKHTSAQWMSVEWMNN